jgi:hypothetical protein
MNVHDATEAAYRNGYAKGYEDGKANAIIRCKDCERYYAPFCFHPDGLYRPKDTDFCSYAKRKE